MGSEPPRQRKQRCFAWVAGLLVLLIVYGISELGTAVIVYGLGYYLPALDREYYHKLISKDPPWRFKKNVYVWDSRSGLKHVPSNAGMWRQISYPKAEFRIKIEINANGFRSSKDYTPAFDGIRVAVLGDSFVQAFQVNEEDSFVKVTEKVLRDTGYPVEVLNFGLGSTGTVHQFGMLTQSVMPLDPDVVVLAWFPNDLVDNSPAYWHEKGALLPQYQLSPEGVLSVDPFMADAANVPEKKRTVLAEYSRWDWKAWENVAQVLEQSRCSLFLRFIAVLIQDRILPKKEYDLAFDIYKKEYGPALRESVQVTAILIERMMKMCQGQGKAFLVMLIPSLEQMNSAEFRQYLRSMGGALPQDDFDVDTPQRMIIRELSERRVPFFDLKHDLTVHNKPWTLYYPVDRHFNVQGHQEAGRALAEELKRIMAEVMNKRGLDTVGVVRNNN